MTTLDILARNEVFTLLQDNFPKKIGEIRPLKYCVGPNKIDHECKLVVFDFDQDENEDCFFFHRGFLIFNAISEKSYLNRMWIYQDLIRKIPISLDEFTQCVIDAYTSKEMGF